MIRALPSLCLLLLTMPVAQALEISDPWSPEAPPGRMMAGFMTIHNPSDQPVVLTDAESPGFAHVEIHTMSMEDGVMRMRRLDQLEISHGETVLLEPGGLHLMLIEPREVFRAGDVLEVELIDANGQRYALSVEVRPRQRPAMRQ